MRVTLPNDGANYTKAFLETTVKITLSGKGWPSVTNDQVLSAMADNSIDIRDIRTVWKGSNMRYLNITFESTEQAVKATALAEMRIGEALATIAGRETATEVKIHWVPAWIGDEFVLNLLRKYGEVLDFRSETATIGGTRVYTGTKVARLRTTPEKAKSIPTAFEVQGPVAARLLVSVRGRPPLCLQCFTIGHKQRFCPSKRPPAPADALQDRQEDDAATDATETRSEDAVAAATTVATRITTQEEYANDTDKDDDNNDSNDNTNKEDRDLQSDSNMEAEITPEVVTHERPVVDSFASTDEEPDIPVTSTPDSTPENPATDANVTVEHPPWTTTPNATLTPPPDSPKTVDERDKDKRRTESSPYSRPRDRQRSDSRGRRRQTSTEVAERAEKSLNRFLERKDGKETYRPWEQPDWPTPDQPRRDETTNRRTENRQLQPGPKPLQLPPYTKNPHPDMYRVLSQEFTYYLTKQQFDDWRRRLHEAGSVMWWNDEIAHYGTDVEVDPGNYQERQKTYVRHDIGKKVYYRP